VLAGGGGSGALLALLAAIGITAGTLLIRQLDGLDLVVVSAGHFLLGGAVLVGLAALLEGPPAIAWTPRFLASLAFLTLLGTAVAFVLWFEEARRAPLAAVSTWTLLVPVFGVAFGAVLLGERLAARELVGVVTVVLGVATVQARQQWQSRRAAVPSGRDHDGTRPSTGP
jgi:drug/metabolite transporter (DMT)-like permease